MYWEQTSTREASWASQHSMEWMPRFRSPGSQPWCRPASVAWTVATSGMPRWSLTVTAAWATSQSWAWTSSKSSPRAACSAVRVRVWLKAMAQASRCWVSSGMTGGSCGARTTRTPSTTSSRGAPGACRVATVTSWPARARCGGQGVDMPSEAADHDRRVLPGEHQELPFAESGGRGHRRLLVGNHGCRPLKACFSAVPPASGDEDCAQVAAVRPSCSPIGSRAGFSETQ